MPEDSIGHIDFNDLNRRAISGPLVKHIYTADPSAHVFEGKIYIYPSHDIDTNIPFDDLAAILQWRIIMFSLWRTQMLPSGITVLLCM